MKSVFEKQFRKGMTTKLEEGGLSERTTKKITFLRLPLLTDRSVHRGGGRAGIIPPPSHPPKNTP